MENFFSRLNRNPYQPIDGASVTKFDELGNGLDDWGNVIAPRFEAPEQTWGETALGVATAPARLATALAGSLSPYGADGWQVPPIVNEGVNALTAVGDAYTQGMSEDEMRNRALGMAGFMMGGGGVAAGRAPMLAANTSKEGALPGIASALKGLRIEPGDPDSPYGASYQVVQDGADSPVAEFYYEDLPNALMVKHASVSPDFRRQGIASAVYGRMQDDLGKPMTPDVKLTEDGYNFWKAHYPEAVRDHRFNGMNYSPFKIGDQAAEAFERSIYENGAPDWRMSGGPNRPEGALWSNASKESSIPALASALDMSPEASYRGYRGVVRADSPGPKPDGLQAYWMTDNKDMASSYAKSWYDDLADSPAVFPTEARFDNPLVVDANGSDWRNIQHMGDYYTSSDLIRLASANKNDGVVIKNVIDPSNADLLSRDGISGVPPATVFAAINRGTVRSPLTGETLFSNADSKPALLASALGQEQNVPDWLLPFLQGM